MRLTNKHLLVTGAGRGMGREAALGAAREGARVTVVDINAVDGAETVRLIAASGGSAIFARTDVTRAADCAAMVEAAETAFGPLNAGYINAAVQLVGQDARAHELSEEIWDRTLSINLKGMWLSCKYVLASMLKAGGGSLVLAGSPTGLKGAAGYTAYASSKAGSFALARTIAADYARDNIRCNVLVPGPMRTPLTTDLFNDPDFLAATLKYSIAGRIGEADEIVPMLTFLLSDESKYCTAGYFMVDGGYTA